jgi:hypothetical protein
LSAEQSGRYLRPFIESLPTQWLQVDRVKTAAPSPTIYPGWDAALAEAMQAESKLYFAEIVRENRSALDLIRSNFTFVNERLARHYGLTGVTGSQIAQGGHHRHAARRDHDPGQLPDGAVLAREHLDRPPGQVGAHQPAVRARHRSPGRRGHHQLARGGGAA